MPPSVSFISYPISPRWLRGDVRRILFRVFEWNSCVWITSRSCLVVCFVGFSSAKESQRNQQIGMARWTNHFSQQRAGLHPTFESHHMKQTFVMFQPQNVEWKGHFQSLCMCISGDAMTVGLTNNAKPFRIVAKGNESAIYMKSLNLYSKCQ
jgi:hypothetical protein